MKVRKRRSHIEIIANMLKIGENGAGKTEIMYSANMSYSQIQKYLGYLMGQGFISQVKVGNPCVTYHMTEKGFKLLHAITSALDMLGLSADEEF